MFLLECISSVHFTSLNIAARIQTGDPKVLLMCSSTVSYIPNDPSDEEQLNILCEILTLKVHLIYPTIVTYIITMTSNNGKWTSEEENQGFTALWSMHARQKMMEGLCKHVEPILPGCMLNTVGESRCQWADRKACFWPDNVGTEWSFLSAQVTSRKPVYCYDM